MTHAFASHAIVRVAPDVLATLLGEDTVILDLKAGTYFGLNDVGTHVWHLIATGRSVGDIRDAIVAEYNVAADTCEADLQSLLHQLVDRQLAEVVADDGATR